MAIISRPNDYEPNTTIASADVNTNESTIYADYNGNITNANISATAAIVDTKLAQIATASKVSGTALTNMASIPSAAGVIPAVNLPGPASIDVVTADGTDKLTSSVSKETLYSFSVPANTIGTDGLLKVNLWGTLKQDSGGNAVITYRLEYGGTVMCTTAMTTGDKGTDLYVIRIEAWLKGDGATNAQESFLLTNSVIPGAGTSQQEFMAQGMGTAAEDSTGALNILVTAQSDTNSAAIILNLKAATIERLSAV